MNILFAIQGTGNGHLSRAKDIYPQLAKYGNTDVLVSGYQSDIDIPFPVKYRLKGLSFIFGKHGGVDLKETIKKIDPLQFIKDVKSIPVQNYDLVVNDFEPITAWACKLKKIPCIALSHQSAVVHAQPNLPRFKYLFGKFILRYYAPFKDYYGFHFQSNDFCIFPPVIRQEVQQLQPNKGNHYVVYLPAYDDDTLKMHLMQFPGIEWHIFSKHCNEAYNIHNLSIYPIENNLFLKSLAACRGALLGAGFEAPAEALFLRKKLMVIPMKKQYEQQCNALSIAKLGVPTIPELHQKHLPEIDKWLSSDAIVEVDFPKETAAMAVSILMENFLPKPVFPFSVKIRANHYNRKHNYV